MKPTRGENETLFGLAENQLRDIGSLLKLGLKFALGAVKTLPNPVALLAAKFLRKRQRSCRADKKGVRQEVVPSSNKQQQTWIQV